MLGHVAYLSVLTGLVALVSGSWHAAGPLMPAALTVGAIGLWRYAWAGLNFLRAVIYVTLAYPRRRAAAERAHAARQGAVAGHAFFLITSYKIAPETTARVYRALFAAAARAEGGATIVASVVEGADVRLIQRLHAALGPAMPGVRLVIDRIPASGNRDAIARALRLISREAPSARDILLLVDGDTIVPADIVARAQPFFIDPRIGALTTDEEAEVTGSALFGQWFALRFTQRQMMMSSMALGGRVLTLTGRMSVFRADLATDPGFIAQVQHDRIEHWRLGRIDFLTGDDKSTWFWLLSRGYRMTYLPDVRCLSLESQPRPSFTGSALVLMKRWFGNMLRTNGRALALGPGRIGLFTWWSVLDQRLSIFTTLSGPIAVVLSALFVSPLALPAYAAWVMFTRYLFCALISLFRGGGFPAVWPLLLYVSQIGGAAVKCHVLFRLNRQSWTRQPFVGAGSGTGAGANRTGAGTWFLSSRYLNTLALGWLTLGVAALLGLLF